MGHLWVKGLGFREYATSAMCCEGLGRASSVQACGKREYVRRAVLDGLSDMIALGVLGFGFWVSAACRRMPGGYAQISRPRA